MGHAGRARRRATAGTVGLVLASGYTRLVRPRMARWGASDDEVAAAMPGDGEVAGPQLAVTRAVTIAVSPAAVWPWLVQIGYHRAGWYAYDLFDNDDIPSAESILPEFQHVEIGQVLGEEGFAVREVEPNRHLVLAFHHPKTKWVVKQGVWPLFGHASMCLQLNPVHDGERTRLVYRVRFSTPAWARIFTALFEPADFLSSRKMLIGIKRRAETRGVHPVATLSATQAASPVIGVV
jgi:uncharacterized protein YndB with AHSA1/START domain